MPFRSPKMNGFIFGFQRFVWCPKWTPASSSSFMAIPAKLPPVGVRRGLPLAELEALPRSGQPVLLALLAARVARQEPFLLQARPQLAVVLDERARDPQPYGAGLPRHAASGDRRIDVELVCRLGQQQRLLDLGAQRLGGEEVLELPAVDADRSGAGPEEHAR